MNDELMNIHEAAQFLGRKHQSIRRLVADGTLPAYLEGKAYIFKKKDLEKIKEEKYPEGLSHSDIAREYQVNRTTVIEQFRRLKVEPFARRHGYGGKANVYTRSTVAKFAHLLGWDRRHKNPIDE